MAAAVAATKFSSPPSSTTGHGFFFFPKSKGVPTPSPSLSISSISCATAERTRSCTRRGSRDGTLMISSSLMLTSCAKYVRPQNSLLIAFRKPSLVNKVKYRSTIKCATMEEIDAEKSLIENEAKGRMEKTLETLKASFNGVRTGRANPAMLDRVEVEYYGTPVSLKSIAQVSTPDSSTLIVQPYDKSSLKVIEKAIVNSNLDMSPNNDGDVIRLVIPPLTADRRKELSKIVSKQSEEGKVAIRNIRRDAMKAYEKLEKEKKLSEDNVKDLSADLQKVTDEYVKKIDSLQKQKDKELLKV